jgi:transcriptional regulator with XRE-family HTH domain
VEKMNSYNNLRNLNLFQGSVFWKNYLRREISLTKENYISIRSLFSKNLKRLRAAANISQLTLATEAGLTHNFINDIENGKKWVSAETIAKLAAALKAEPYQFFLSESKWNNQGAEIFSLYLDDFSDTFQKMVGEYRQRYLPALGKTEAPAKENR